MTRPFFNCSKAVFAVVAAMMSFALELQPGAQTKMLVCESAMQSCKMPGVQLSLVWTFNGAEGTIDSVAGSHLAIERMDNQAIVVRRTDTDGLSATYTGKVRGTWMDGDVEYTWPGQPGYPRKGTFAAQLQDQLAASQELGASTVGTADGLPKELLVCEDGGMCNSAWTLNGSEGTGIWFNRAPPTKAKLTVLRSSADDIRIRRVDSTDATTAIYTGRLMGDRYTGTIIWSSPGHPGDRSGSWTASVPQTRCDQTAGLGSALAMRLGQNALMFKRDQDAAGCYTVAARDGDKTAQMAIGMMYYQGRDAVPQDFAQALFWLRKAADQGLYNAQRTVAEMYKVGQGTKRDVALAEVYTARADEQKHDYEVQLEMQERAKDRSAQVLSGFVMGASFGLFF